MTPSDSFAGSVRSGDRLPDTIRHDNDNWQAKPAWMSPAELMQIIRREREAMRRELMADVTLRTCPEHRHFRESLDGLEAFARWHYFREG